MHQNEKGNFMSLYTIVFIFVTILIITGLALFGILISHLQLKIKREKKRNKEDKFFKRISENKLILYKQLKRKGNSNEQIQICN